MILSDILYLKSVGYPTFLMQMGLIRHRYDIE
jgi:hypothetical protein